MKPPEIFIMIFCTQVKYKYEIIKTSPGKCMMRMYFELISEVIQPLVSTLSTKEICV